MHVFTESMSAAPQRHSPWWMGLKNGLPGFASSEAHLFHFWPLWKFIFFYSVCSSATPQSNYYLSASDYSGGLSLWLNYMGLHRIYRFYTLSLSRKVRSLPSGGSRKCVLLCSRIKSRLESFLKLPFKSRTTSASSHPLVSPSSLEFSFCL